MASKPTPVPLTPAERKALADCRNAKYLAQAYRILYPWCKR